jgi:hypothetical protein
MTISAAAAIACGQHWSASGQPFGGRLGRVWRETDEEGTDRETLIRDPIDDQYGNPVRLVEMSC